MKKDVKYKVSPKGRKKPVEHRAGKSYRNVKLPLKGKTLYLDVKDAKHLKRLQADLKTLGATVEEFVSKDINYLITSQSRPKLPVRDPYGDASPTPSPFNCEPSPSPGNPEERKIESVTRGKALLEKARVNTRQTSTLLDNAEKWGVKIVQLESALKWISKELKKLPKSASHSQQKSSKCVSSYKILKSPYIKCEAENFSYQPFHIELDHWPRLNADTPRGSCPFDGTLIKCGDDSREERGELQAAQVDDIGSEDTPREEKDAIDDATHNTTTKHNTDGTGKKSVTDFSAGNRILTAGELKRRKDLKRKLEKKRGFCECCHVKYENIDKHVEEEQHRVYVKDKSHYSALDELIDSGPSTSKFLLQIVTNAATQAMKRNHANRNNRQKNPASPSKTSLQHDTVARRSPRKHGNASQIPVSHSAHKTSVSSTSKSPVPVKTPCPTAASKSPMRGNSQDLKRFISKSLTASNNQDVRKSKSPMRCKDLDFSKSLSKSPNASNKQDVRKSPRKSLNQSLSCTPVPSLFNRSPECNGDSAGSKVDCKAFRSGSPRKSLQVVSNAHGNRCSPRKSLQIDNNHTTTRTKRSPRKSLQLGSAETSPKLQSPVKSGRKVLGDITAQHSPEKNVNESSLLSCHGASLSGVVDGCLDSMLGDSSAHICKQKHSATKNLNSSFKKPETGHSRDKYPVNSKGKPAEVATEDGEESKTTSKKQLMLDQEKLTGEIISPRKQNIFTEKSTSELKSPRKRKSHVENCTEEIKPSSQPKTFPEKGRSTPEVKLTHKVKSTEENIFCTAEPELSSPRKGKLHVESRKPSEKEANNCGDANKKELNTSYAHSVKNDSNNRESSKRDTKAITNETKIMDTKDLKHKASELKSQFPKTPDAQNNSKRNDVKESKNKHETTSNKASPDVRKASKFWSYVVEPVPVDNTQTLGNEGLPRELKQLNSPGWLSPDFGAWRNKTGSTSCERSNQNSDIESCSESKTTRKSKMQNSDIESCPENETTNKSKDNDYSSTRGKKIVVENNDKQIRHVRKPARNVVEDSEDNVELPDDDESGSDLIRDKLVQSRKTEESKSTELSAKTPDVASNSKPKHKLAEAKSQTSRTPDVQNDSQQKDLQLKTSELKSHTLKTPDAQSNSKRRDSRHKQTESKSQTPRTPDLHSISKQKDSMKHKANDSKSNTPVQNKSKCLEETKFWSFVVEQITSESDADTGDEHLPNELRKLKRSVPGGWLGSDIESRRCSRGGGVVSAVGAVDVLNRDKATPVDNGLGVDTKSANNSKRDKSIPRVKDHVENDRNCSDNNSKKVLTTKASENHEPVEHLEKAKDDQKACTKTFENRDSVKNSPNNTSEVFSKPVEKTPDAMRNSKHKLHTTTEPTVIKPKAEGRFWTYVVEPVDTNKGVNEYQLKELHKLRQNLPHRQSSDTDSSLPLLVGKQRTDNKVTASLNNSVQNSEDNCSDVEVMKTTTASSKSRQNYSDNKQSEIIKYESQQGKATKCDNQQSRATKPLKDKNNDSRVSSSERGKKDGKNWFYVEEPVESSEEDEDFDNLPKELQNLKRSMPNMFIPGSESRQSRRSSYANSVKQMSYDSSSVTETHRSTSKTKRQSENVKQDYGGRENRNDESHGSKTIKCLDSDVSSDARKVTNISKPKEGRFWCYVKEPVKNKSDKVVNPNIPNELKALQDFAEWYSANTSDTEKRRSRCREIVSSERVRSRSAHDEGKQSKQQKRTMLISSEHSAKIPRQTQRTRIKGQTPKTDKSSSSQRVSNVAKLAANSFNQLIQSGKASVNNKSKHFDDFEVCLSLSRETQENQTIKFLEKKNADVTSSDYGDAHKNLACNGQKHEKPNQDASSECIEEVSDTTSVQVQPDLVSDMLTSDFTYIDLNGEIQTFTKTLADRIKERAVRRASSGAGGQVGSNSPSSCTSTSRFSVRNSSEMGKNKVKKSHKLHSPSKLLVTSPEMKNRHAMKSGTNIASAKVVKKYRMRRRNTSAKQESSVQNGYQGDDEMDKNARCREAQSTGKVKHSHHRYLKKDGQYWYYEPIIETKTCENGRNRIRLNSRSGQKAIPKMLRELQVSTPVLGSDNSDTDSIALRSRLKQEKVIRIDVDHAKDNERRTSKTRPVVSSSIVDSDCASDVSCNRSTKKDARNSWKPENESNDVTCNTKKDARDSPQSENVVKRKKRFWYYEAVVEDSDNDCKKDKKDELEARHKGSRQLQSRNENSEKSDVDNADRLARNSSETRLNNRQGSDKHSAARSVSERNASSKMSEKSVETSAQEDGGKSNNRHGDTNKNAAPKRQRRKKVFWEYVPIDDEKSDNTEMSEDSKVSKKQYKKKIFWEYVPIVEDETNDSNEDVEIVSERLRGRSVGSKRYSQRSSKSAVDYAKFEEDEFKTSSESETESESEESSSDLEEQESRYEESSHDQESETEYCHKKQNRKVAKDTANRKKHKHIDHDQNAESNSRTTASCMHESKATRADKRSKLVVSNTENRTSSQNSDKKSKGVESDSEVEHRNRAEQTSKHLDSGSVNRSLSQSRPRKRKIFWEYQVVTDDKEADLDDLPTALQRLKCRWNHLPDDDQPRKRSRSRNSDAQITDVHTTTSEKRDSNGDHVSLSRNRRECKDRSDSCKKTNRVNDMLQNPDESNASASLKKTISNRQSEKSLVGDSEIRSRSPVFKSRSSKDFTPIRRSSPVFNRSPMSGKAAREKNIGTRVKTDASNSSCKTDKRNSVQSSRLGDLTISTSFDKETNDGKNVETATSESKDSNKAVSANRMKSSCNVDRGCTNVRDYVATVVEKNEVLSKSSSKITSETTKEIRKSNSKIHKSDSKNESDTVVVTTPERVIKLPDPSSGVSTTPREHRRKLWKRKQSELREDSGSRKSKQRKLDDDERCVEGNERDAGTVCDTVDVKQRHVKQNLESSYRKSYNSLGTGCVNQSPIRESEVATNSKGGHSVSLVPSDAANKSFALTWAPAHLVGSGYVASNNKSDKIKLNKSWSLLSERSVNKLLSSDDDRGSFHGFDDDCIEDTTLPSDLSYDECSEIDLPGAGDSEHEWMVEDQDTSVDSPGKFEPLDELVSACAFSSPGRKSDSSWIDACETYIDKSVNYAAQSSNTKLNSSSVYYSAKKSPRKLFAQSPLKFVQSPRKLLSQSPMQYCKSPVKCHSISKSSKNSNTSHGKQTCSMKYKSDRHGNDRHSNHYAHHHDNDADDDIELIDEDIVFNFGSPQKNDTEFSPLKTVNGIVTECMSPIIKTITSTPVKLGKKTRTRLSIC